MEGTVKVGGKPAVVRMKINSRTDMDNLCPCPASRRRGQVCDHVVAVGLEVLEPMAKGEAPAAEFSGRRPEAKEVVKVEVEDRWPEIVEEEGETEGAVAARFEVMLPLRVAESWERGQLTVGIGVEMNGETFLFGVVKSGERLFVGERDGRMLGVLKRLCPGEAPGMAGMGRGDFLALLEGLAGHPRTWYGKKARAQVGYSGARLGLTVSGLRVKALWPAGVVKLVADGRAWALQGEALWPVAAGLPAEWCGVLEDGGLTLKAEEAESVLGQLEAWFDVEEGALEDVPRAMAPAVEVVFEGSLNHIEATLAFMYGGERRLAGSGRAEVVDAGGRRVLTSPLLEQGAIDVLKGHGFEMGGKPGKLVLKDKQAILKFHAHGVQRLDPEWNVRLGPLFRHAAGKVVAVAPVFEFSQSSGQDWFGMGVEYRSASGQVVPREMVQRLMQSGRNDSKMANGKTAVFDTELEDELGETLTDCDGEQERPGVFRIDKRQTAFLRQAASASNVACEGSVPWSERGSKGKLEVKLNGLVEVLRPYQLEGVRWLWELAEAGMGGVLADDMGLGKTLQTLAFLQARGGKSLVVCPSSLVENWVAEAAKFVPGMNAVALHGPKRAKVLVANADADLLVTSYALLRLDEEVYRRMEFEVVVLDEAQQIKNPDAKVSKVAFRLGAATKVALTGTPVENSVQDVWSIMNFALPGYLGRREVFAERFVKPLARGDEPALARRLGLRLRPVVKRRLKQEVAADLPEKIEQVRYCDLTDKQRGVYEAILKESRSMVQDAEGGRKRMVALTALLRLRQACCDVRLLGMDGADAEEAGAKMVELEELIREAVEGGHRVLVFSQFVQLLQVVVPMLSERGWGFCYLDGSTKNRAAEVARFQGDASLPVFLISLKAGGVGLNLTGADTVIHLDPWWNPAVEAQATDRAHRIGQKRVVTSYKLIARGTVEEKILALQERKRGLMDAALDGGMATGGSALSEEEIFEMLKS